MAAKIAVAARRHGGGDRAGHRRRRGADPRGRADRPGHLPGARPAPCRAARQRPGRTRPEGRRRRAGDGGSHDGCAGEGTVEDMSRTLLSPERRRADRAAARATRSSTSSSSAAVSPAPVPPWTPPAAACRSALLEARDWAAGTSSRSSKLIHGGLRYLEQFAFPLVHEALHERSRLVQTIAPHLVSPLPFLLPLTAPVWQRAYYGAGVALYDVLGAAFTRERAIPRHRHLSRTATLEAFPGLRGDVVRGVDPLLGRAGRRRPAHAGRRPHRRRLRRPGALQRPGHRAAARRRRAESRRSSACGWPTSPTGRRSPSGPAASSPRPASGATTSATMLGDSAPSLKVRASKGVHLVVPRSAIDGADAGRRRRARRTG